MVHYPAGSTIVRKGDAGDSMLALVGGRVKICSTSPDGKELLLNIMKPGDIFGEISLLDGHPRTAEAVALDDYDLLLLERQIGRAHVRTPVTTAHLVCRLPLEK